MMDCLKVFQKPVFYLINLISYISEFRRFVLKMILPIFRNLVDHFSVRKGNRHLEIFQRRRYWILKHWNLLLLNVYILHKMAVCFYFRFRPDPDHLDLFWKVGVVKTFDHILILGVH